MIGVSIKSKSGVLSAFVSILVGLLTILIMGSSYRFLFAALMALITYMLVSLGVEDNSEVRIKIPKAILEVGVPEIIWVVVLVVAFSLSSRYVTGIFVRWDEIPSLNLLRALAFYSLVLFYPGYGLVTLLINSRRHMTGIEVLVVSVGMSLFLSGSLALLVWLAAGAIGSINSYLVILLNALLLMLRLVQRRKALGKKVINGEKSFDLFTFGIVGGIVLFTVMGTFAVNLPDNITHGFDVWSRFAGVHEMIVGVPIVAEYNYSMFLLPTALFIASSGMPFINAYQLSFFLTSLHILAFYLMCSVILSKRRAALATLIYATFSGLGGLYSMYLRTVQGIDFWSAAGASEGRCFDLVVGIQGYSYFYQPVTIAYAFLFIFLYLAFSKEYPRFARITLMILSFAAGYLTELTVIPILVALIFLTTLLNVKILDKPKDVVLSELLGLLFALGFLNAFASGLPVSMENLSPLFVFFPYLLAAVAATLALTYLRAKISRRVEAIKLYKARWNWLGVIQNKAPVIISLLCLYILLTLFIFWIYLPPYLANYKLFGGMVPWYVYPVKLGLPVFMAVIAIPLIVRKGDSHILKLGAIIILTAILAGNVASYLRENNLMYLSHDENRWLIYSWGGISILASYGLWRLLQIINEQLTVRSLSKSIKKLVCVALLVFILVGGVSSTLLTIESHGAYINNIKTPKEELNAYNNLGLAVDPYGVVATPGYRAWNKITFYGPRVSLDEGFQDFFFKSIHPDFLGEVLSHNPFATIAPKDSGVSRWYVLKPVKELLPRGLVLNYLANYLPIADENEWLVLYDFPAISPSTSPSTTAFISSFILREEDGHLKRIIVDDSQNKFWSVRLEYPGQYGLQVEENKKERVTGESSLLLNVTQGSYGRVAVQHYYEEPQDWSSYDFLSLYWYGTGSRQRAIAVQIYAPDPSNHLWIEWDDTFIGWRKLRFSLSEFNRFGKPDLKNVTFVEIRLWPQSISTFFLDQLALEREASEALQVYTEEELVLQLSLSMSYTNYTELSIFDPAATSPSTKTILLTWDLESPPANLLSWIEKGGTLVIFQGESLNRTGFFGKTLKLTPYEEYVMVDSLAGRGGQTRLPVLTQSNVVGWDSSEVTPIAWYTRYGNQVTPYALLKTVGEGRVVYVIATPYIEALRERTGTEEGRALFSHLEALVEVLGLPMERYREPPRSVYAYITGSALLDNGQIEARSLLPALALKSGLPEENVGIEAKGILIGGSRLSNLTLRGWRIESLEKAQITFNQALLYPTYIPGYAKVQIAGSFNMTLTPRQGTSIILRLDNGTITSTISTQDTVSLEVHGDKQEKTEFYLKEAEFSVGSAQFEKILFDFFMGINNPGLPMSVKDGMKFKIQNVDENFVLATDVVINGRYTVLVAEHYITYSRWLFPTEALISPFFLLLTYITGEQIAKVMRKTRKFKEVDEIH